MKIIKGGELAELLQEGLQIAVAMNDLSRMRVGLGLGEISTDDLQTAYQLTADSRGGVDLSRFSFAGC